jgi:hypothetical protein
MAIALRNESHLRLVPSLSQLRRDGKASAKRIAGFEADIARTSRVILAEWFDQAERLSRARKLLGIKGAEFRAFAVDIGIAGSTAFQIERLDGHREVVFAMGEKSEAVASARGEIFRWPSWRQALEIASPHKVANHQPSVASNRPAMAEQNRWGRLTNRSDNPHYISRT